MKVVYSLILLLSFLVGTLQPIMPAIDYQLSQGDIFELLASTDCDSEQEPADFISYLDKDCTPTEKDSDQNLLNIDYYPLALQLSSIPSPSTFPNKSRLFIALWGNVINLNFLPNPPPPRMS